MTQNKDEKTPDILIGLVAVFIIGFFLVCMSLIAYKCRIEVKTIELRIEQERGNRR